MDREYLDGLVEHLIRQGVDFRPGLSDAEVVLAEQTFGLRFPPDLRSILQHALPVSDGFPDWRSCVNPELRERLAWPLEGLLFDVEYNAFWMEIWGSRPARLDDAFDLARLAVAEAPVLIPVYSHRYLPTEPMLPGNPVLSVYQTDIIVYGNDLASSYHAEFGAPIPHWAGRAPRTIRFWSRLLG